MNQESNFELREAAGRAKKTQITIVAVIIAGLLATSCTKEQIRIEGEGTITSQTLNVADFSRLAISGVDDVYIQHGRQQKVEVKGHPNLFGRIKTEVRNDTWYCQLENGNYGDYELTYYITIPSIEQVRATGTGDVIINDSMTQDQLYIELNGTGDFLGFQMTAESCEVDITGSGDCEITASGNLDVVIEGSGSVYYKGDPSLQVDITGSGSVVNAN